MKNSAVVLVLISLLAATGCREEDGPFSGEGGRLFISSDPEGARILIDANDTGFFTPDTLEDAGGVNDVLLHLDSAGFLYTANARVIVRSGQLQTLRAPLSIRCSSTECFARNSVQYSHGNMSFRINAAGPLFYTTTSSEPGLVWPANSSDRYVAMGMPLIAAQVNGEDVALGIYNGTHLAGRPAPVVTNSGGELRIDQRSWITPRTLSNRATIRGIEVRQQILVDAALPDVMLIRLTYRNISTSPLYAVTDLVGADSTYEEVYLGFGIDPDIGQALDDWTTYDPSLDAVITYDANFSDSQLSAGTQNAPGLVGVRMLSAPFGARVVLNAYHSGTPQTPGLGDWQAGQTSEPRGWGVMSGLGAYEPDHPDQNIGALVPAPADIRMLVSAGPYVLRPSEEISVIVAVAIASPTPGTFTSAELVPPGSPQDAGRQIMLIAADLRAKLAAAETLLPKMTN